MHTRVRASSIAALVLALGATTTAQADPAPPIAGSAAAKPAPSTPPAGVMAMLPAAPVAPPKLPMLVNADAPIPTNGSLLFDLRGASTSVMIWLEDVTGSRTDGVARVFDTFLIWTPSSALVPNRLYTLNVTSTASFPRDQYTVSAGSEIELSRPPMSAMLRLERVENMTSPKCCASVPGFPVRSSACFSTETKPGVRMRGALSSTASPSHLTQFMFRLRRAGDESVSGQAGFTPLVGIQPLLWTDPAEQEEFCAELSALDIRSGRTFDYEDLGMRCLSAESLGDLSARPIPIDAARVLSHTICSVPPRDFETEWCDTNEVDCSGSPLTSGCENWDHMCQGGPAPKPAGVGIKRQPIDDVRPSPSPRASDSREDAGFGCSVAPGRAGSWLAAISGACAWLLLANRRRRSARRVSAR